MVRAAEPEAGNNATGRRRAMNLRAFMNEKPKAKVIPISVVAQEPKSAEAEIHGCAELEFYALRVLGDSMAPEFLEGHVVIVDPGMPLAHGAYVVIDYQSETTFRQYWVEGERKVPEGRE